MSVSEGTWTFNYLHGGQSADEVEAAKAAERIVEKIFVIPVGDRTPSQAAEYYHAVETLDPGRLETLLQRLITNP